MTNSFTSQITSKIETEKQLLEAHQHLIQAHLNNGIVLCEKLNNALENLDNDVSATISKHTESLNSNQQQLNLMLILIEDLNQRLYQYIHYTETVEEQAHQQNSHLSQLEEQIQQTQQIGIDTQQQMAKADRIALSQLKTLESLVKRNQHELLFQSNLHQVYDQQTSAFQKLNIYLLLLASLVLINSMALLYILTRGI